MRTLTFTTQLMTPFVSLPTIIVGIDLRRFLREGDFFGPLNRSLISLRVFEKNDHMITSSMTTS